jgi:NitT/TauT family transport system substrate-binding protein
MKTKNRTENYMRVHGRTVHSCALIFLLFAVSYPALTSGQTTRLRASYASITANTTPAWIAKEKGFFGKNQLDVDLILIESGTTNIQALIAGEIQIVQTAGGVVISSGLAGSDVIAIAGLENRLAYSLIAQNEVKTPGELKGKRLAISRFGSASDIGARLILQKLNLIPEKDVALVQVGGTSTRLAAVMKGAVASTVITPEFYLVAKKAGLTTLADPRSIKIDFPLNGIVARRAFIKSQPAVITQYLKAIIEAIHFYKNNRDESIRIMGTYLKISDREVLDPIYDHYADIFMPLPVPSRIGMQTLLEWMGQRDPRAKEANVDQFIDATILAEIEKSGFVDRLYGKK